MLRNPHCSPCTCLWTPRSSCFSFLWGLHSFLQHLCIQNREFAKNFITLLHVSPTAGESLVRPTYVNLCIPNSLGKVREGKVLRGTGHSERAPGELKCYTRHQHLRNGPPVPFWAGVFQSRAQLALYLRAISTFSEAHRVLQRSQCCHCWETQKLRSPWPRLPTGLYYPAAPKRVSSGQWFWCQHPGVKTTWFPIQKWSSTVIGSRAFPNSPCLRHGRTHCSAHHLHTTRTVNSGCNCLAERSSFLWWTHTTNSAS